ncbi:MAG TPA: hypothetical protein RMH99_07055 [Sandaracinaceae bacterium LLY-WYZ-13_1]|nr:hypothetical protein [Sandaracinaceae bacterium LLY-WYZ-13_1]
MACDVTLHWPAGLPRDAADELLVVIGDVEIGPGGPTDDFPQSEFLGDLLLRYCEPPFAELPVTVVFDGDTFDLLKTPLEDGSFPIHVTEAIALAKLERVIAAHGPFFERLRRFLAHDGAPRKLSFVVGNHDMELFFEGVQARVREALGEDAAGSEAVVFPGLRHRQGRVHVEHGMQHDPLFAVDAERPFIEHPFPEPSTDDSAAPEGDDRRILNLPWGTVALLEVALQFLPELHQLDRLKPKKAVLAALPEVRDLLVAAYWRYWTRDFWQSYWTQRDPLRRVSWTMLQEVAWRFGTGDPDVSMQDCRRLLHRRHDDTTLIVLGHEHEPAWWSSAERRVLRTGCFRNEYALDLEHGEHRLLSKVYAEVYLRDGRPVRSHLVEVDAPPPAQPAVPTRLEEVLEHIPRLRASEGGDAVVQRRARKVQERAEADEPVNRGLPGFVETLRNVLGRDL